MIRSRLSLGLASSWIAVALFVAACSSSSTSADSDASTTCSDESFSDFYADAGPDVATTPEGCDAACAASDVRFHTHSCCHGFGYGCSYLGTSLACVFSCTKVPDAAGE